MTRKLNCIARSVAIVFLVILVVNFSGCAARAKNITGLPAGVSQSQVQSWDAAVANLQKISVTASSLRQAVIALNRAGAFPDGPAYVATLTGIGKIDQLQIAASQFLQSVPNDWSLPTQTKVQAYVQQIQAALTDVTNSGVVGIKDATSKSQVDALITNLRAAANVIIGLVG